MRMLHFFYSVLSILLFSCSDIKNTTETISDTTSVDTIVYKLFDCDYKPFSVFPSMKTELQELNSSDSLIKEYTIVVDSLILNWDSLVAAENFQISQIKRVIERIELQPAFNKSKLIETKNSLCLVNSNRVPAHQLNDSIRLTMFDNLLEQLKIEASSLVLDLANIPLYTSEEEDQYIDQDSLLNKLGDDILVESIYAVESHDKIIFINSQLYMEAAVKYNQFVNIYRDELKGKGISEIYYFPGFYE